MKISPEDRIDLILGKPLKGTSDAFKISAIKYLLKQEIKKVRKEKMSINCDS